MTLLKNHLVNAGAMTQQRQAELVMTQSLKDSLYSMTPQPTSAGSVVIVTILGERLWQDLFLGKFWSVASLTKREASLLALTLLLYSWDPFLIPAWLNFSILVLFLH